MKLHKLMVVLLLGLAYFTGNAVRAQTITGKLDELFNPSQTSAGFNGNVLVAENGKIHYQKSFGYADFSTNTRNSNDSTFQTASISKVFTATAILQLRDKGKLKLNDPVIKFLSEFPYPNITIQNLLSHTSGLPDLELYETMIKANPELVVTNKDIIPALKTRNKPLKFQPGEKWNYCNTNYALLVLIVEKAGNLAFPDYLKKFIFEPAGMNDTYLRVAASPITDQRLVKNHILPAMYQTTPQAVETVKLKDGVRMWRIRYETYHTGATLGDQNVISTTEDLLKFDQAYYSERLLKSSTIEEAATPIKLKSGETFFDDFGAPFGKKCSYGLGWIVCDDPKTGKIVGHDGFNRGIATIFYRNVTKKQTIIMFDNTEGRGFNERAASVVKILNGENPLPLNLKNSIAREFGATLLNRGIESAILRFNELRKNDAFYLDEKEMNLLGYEFLFNDYKTQSLEVFRLNVLLFPESFNVYDSYAESLAASGKRAEAILMYKKAISLNPNSEGSRKALKLLEDN